MECFHAVDIKFAKYMWLIFFRKLLLQSIHFNISLFIYIYSYTFVLSHQTCKTTLQPTALATNLLMRQH